MTTGQIILLSVSTFGLGTLVGAGLAALGIDIYATRQRRHDQEPA